MIPREKAIEIALHYLGHRFAGRLEAHEGWPGDAGRPDGDVPNDEPNLVIHGMPKRVWRVCIPDDDYPHVGSDNFLIIDGDTGEIFTTVRYGE